MYESNFVALEYSVIGDNDSWGMNTYNEAVYLDDNGYSLSDLYWGEDYDN